jgi:hypothetical protein
LPRVGVFVKRLPIFDCRLKKLSAISSQLSAGRIQGRR